MEKQQYATLGTLSLAWEVVDLNELGRLADLLREFRCVAKVGVLRASHKIFLSLTGKFE
jgi:hypothetical protein